jgi:uncharacterized protein YjbJ (UPF0337 family)
MKLGTIDLNNLRGLSDKFMGFGKEVFGSVTGNERLQQEGEAQQDRATETLKALREQAKAEKHEAKAEAHEQRQKAAQRAKS